MPLDLLRGGLRRLAMAGCLGAAVSLYPAAPGGAHPSPTAPVQVANLPDFSNPPDLPDLPDLVEHIRQGIVGIEVRLQPHCSRAPARAR
ncbi:MAG: hypothetical protein AAGE13_12435, partial [Pseudomonadota bacterium]